MSTTSSAGTPDVSPESAAADTAAAGAAAAPQPEQTQTTPQAETPTPQSPAAAGAVENEEPSEPAVDEEAGKEVTGIFHHKI
ncbi:hypothetical protein [Micrococcus terreus]|uniref:Uncharacterized protein n=1 Tax=Micrococcus terreus TaxID=574650 RepID=A0A1I7MPG9_9MICC|nr:hypothetical protein [Micrococcus terreus]SFV23801.1 hypothetical protein SAMN04487966_108128 [Micrococcus terreus]